MSDRTLVGIARTVGVAGAILAITGMVMVEVTTDYDEPLWRDGAGIAMLLAGFFALFVWLVIPQQPRNAVVWVMAVSGFGAGLYLAGFAGAAALVDDPNQVLGDFVIPASIPAAAAWLVVAALVGVYVSLYAWLTFGLLLFPDGRLPSPRWRWVGVLAFGGLLLMVAGAAWEYRPWSIDPATESGYALEIGAAGVTLAAVLSLFGLIQRFRRSAGAARDQFKWVVWGAAIMVPWFVAGYVLGGTEYEYLFLIPIHVAVAIMLAAFGVAVGKYRLFDIDVVISRTVVYGTLAVVITGAYVAAVVGVGRIVLGSGSEPNPAVAIPATTAVAVAFQPLRRRLQKRANRLVYGKRATPYEVLSEFSHRVAAADTSLLDRVARSLVEGTGAERAAVWVVVGGELVRTAEWPEGSADQGKEAISFAIEHDGVELGRLTLEPPPGQRLTAEDQRLATEVVSGMGLALRNRVLTGALEARVEELRSSRRRLVTVQDETRRKLERDLHDGAQQQLVALKVKLGLARTIAEADAGAETAAYLRRLAEEADEAVEAMRSFARGVYPPLLEAEGLAPAVAALARRFPMPVVVETDHIGRYGAQIEATAYFCVVEALQNVARHAGGVEARLSLAAIDGSLTFEVTDSGSGFDPEVRRPGSGLTNMEDRVDSIGGTLEIVSAPGRGTTVRGSIPVEERP